MFCSECGTKNQDDAVFCTACGKPIKTETASPAKLDPAQAYAPSPAANPLPVALPDGVKGWSWGAFLLNWIWAIGNRTWIGLLAIIPYVGIVVAFWLGFKGREMAWKNGQWESIEHFNRVQKKWSRWGVGLTLGAMLVGILAGIFIPAYADYKHKADEQKVSDEIAAAISAPPNPPLSEPRPAGAAASGTFDSNVDTLPSTINTLAGQLTRTALSDGRMVMTINGAPLFNGEDAQWQKPVYMFKQSGNKQLILMASSGGRGTSCEALFFFLIVQQSGVTATPEFGSCATQGSYSQDGGKIAITIPKMGGHTVVNFDGTTLLEDGNPVNFAADNDPSK
ncbi:zinc-ribbon domain-containing protein [Rugamonas sp. FT107W]|uniref:Zinc-ribbon domain-containing protein n=1 Tax=Duganella vulcania TaxID=2692166 RepID=A0A845HL73_9BURK|nr:zinc ribbon domain-containing protein [Duganella vulcania]MYN19521.1 zinc-ribbon domain-containing protein [Duganella vulcania]